jgi:hypothetical protein
VVFAMAKRRHHRNGQRSNKTTLTKAEPKRASKPSMQQRASKTSLPQAAAVVGFTELDEAFFAAGESEPHLENVAAAQSEVDAEQSRPSLWKRLLGRAA